MTDKIREKIHNIDELFVYDRFVLKHGSTQRRREKTTEFEDELVIKSDDRSGLNYSDFKAMPVDVKRNYISSLFNAVKSPLLGENLPWSVEFLNLYRRPTEKVYTYIYLFMCVCLPTY